MSRKRNAFLASALILSVIVPAAALAQGPMDPSKTPPQLVATYETLADTILGAQHTEWNLVHSILATTYSHAEAIMQRAREKVADGQNARADIELLATLVSQLANEGDAAVAAVRKRLVEGGHHHHHASAAEDEKYDPGFVIVDRAMKKRLLDAANAIGRLGASADVGELDVQWTKVEEAFHSLHAEK